MGALKEFTKQYSQPLQEVDAIIRSCLLSDAPRLTEISTYLADLGGKRVRPLMAVALGLGFGVPLPLKSTDSGRKLLKIAAGIELIHMATLLHDDIIDRAEMRRHKPSAYRTFGDQDTLLTGDFLLVRAFGLCGQLEQEIIAATEEACVALTEGEILETRLTRSGHGVETSLLVARKKTAALFELAAYCAGFYSGLSQEKLIQLRNFGLNLGVAFQIVDDILDVLSTQKELGKAPAQDIREQKPSIVNVLWLESGSPLAERLLRQEAEPAEKDLADALEELRGSKVIEKATVMGREYHQRALQFLNEARSGLSTVVAGHLEAIEYLAAFVLTRVS